MSCLELCIPRKCLYIKNQNSKTKTNHTIFPERPEHKESLNCNETRIYHQIAVSLASFLSHDKRFVIVMVDIGQVILCSGKIRRSILDRSKQLKAIDLTSISYKRSNRDNCTIKSLRMEYSVASWHACTVLRSVLLRNSESYWDFICLESCCKKQRTVLFRITSRLYIFSVRCTAYLEVQTVAWIAWMAVWLQEYTAAAVVRLEKEGAGRVWRRKSFSYYVAIRWEVNLERSAGLI